MRKKIDKINLLRFQAFKQDASNGNVYGYAVYDVRKVHRIEYLTLCDLIFEKTLQVYPFAIVIDKCVGWADASCNTAQIMIAIPLSHNLHLTQEDNHALSM